MSYTTGLGGFSIEYFKTLKSMLMKTPAIRAVIGFYHAASRLPATNNRELFIQEFNIHIPIVCSKKI